MHIIGYKIHLILLYAALHFEIDEEIAGVLLKEKKIGRSR